MSARDLKEDGRSFQVIEPRPLDYAQNLKYEALDQKGDIYDECEDGWFVNTRNNTRTNILNIDNWEKYYSEILKDDKNQFFRVEYRNGSTGVIPMVWMGVQGFALMEKIADGNLSARDKAEWFAMMFKTAIDNYAIHVIEEQIEILKDDNTIQEFKNLISIIKANKPNVQKIVQKARKKEK